VRPCKGAIVASPVLASYDPDPDYFFHWYRDSAVIIDALRLLYGDGSIGATAHEHLVDFARFSHALLRLDGRALVTDQSWRAAVAPDFTQFLRTDADLSAAHGEAIAGETASILMARWIFRAGHARSTTGSRCARWLCCAGWVRLMPRSMLAATWRH